MAIQFLRGGQSTIAGSTKVLPEGQPLIDLAGGWLYIGDGRTQVKDLEPINKSTPLREPIPPTSSNIDASSGSNGSSSGFVTGNLGPGSTEFQEWLQADTISILWKDSTYSTGGDNKVWGYAHRMYTQTWEGGDETTYWRSQFLTLRETTLQSHTIYKLYLITMDWDSDDSEITWTLSDALN